MSRIILVASLATGLLASTGALSVEGTAGQKADDTDACFRKGWQAAARDSHDDGGPAMMLVPGKALKAILAACERKTGVESSRYANVREFDDEDLVPSMANPDAKPTDLVIE